MHAFNICNMLRPNFITITFNELSANILQDLHSNFFVDKHVVEPYKRWFTMGTPSSKLMSHGNLQSPKREKKDKKRIKKRKIYLILVLYHINETKVISKKTRHKKM